MSKSKRFAVWTSFIGLIGAIGIPLSAQTEELIEEVIAGLA